MNIRKSYIALTLISVFAVPPVDAQSARQRARDTAQKTAAAISKSEMVSKLNSAYKSLMRHLRCAVKGDCSAEEKRRIKKTILWIAGALVVFYIGRRWWQPEDPSSLKVRPINEGWLKKLFTRSNGRPTTPKPMPMATLKAKQRASYKTKRAALMKQARGNQSIADAAAFERIMKLAEAAAQRGNYGMAEIYLDRAPARAAKFRITP